MAENMWKISQGHVTDIEFANFSPCVFFFSNRHEKSVFVACCSREFTRNNFLEWTLIFLFLFFFRYLQQGCTRYFCSKETESKLPASRKSKDHSKNGGMRDPIQDDYKNFFMVDKDLKNLGMSDSDRLAVYTTISAVLHLGNIGKILVLFFSYTG